MSERSEWVAPEECWAGKREKSFQREKSSGRCWRKETCAEGVGREHSDPKRSEVWRDPQLKAYECSAMVKTSGTKWSEWVVPTVKWGVVLRLSARRSTWTLTERKRGKQGGWCVEHLHGKASSFRREVGGGYRLSLRKWVTLSECGEMSQPHERKYISVWVSEGLERSGKTER